MPQARDITRQDTLISRSLVQLLVNFFRQLAADALHLGQVVYARADYAFQAAEAGQQFAAPFGAYAADALQGRSQAGLAAARTMAGDGETMRLVADGLDQMQSRVVARKLNAGLRISANQLFQPRTDKHTSDLQS